MKSIWLRIYTAILARGPIPRPKKGERRPDPIFEEICRQAAIERELHARGVHPDARSFGSRGWVINPLSDDD